MSDCRRRPRSTGPPAILNKCKNKLCCTTDARDTRQLSYFVYWVIGVTKNITWTNIIWIKTHWQLDRNITNLPRISMICCFFVNFNSFNLYFYIMWHQQELYFFLHYTAFNLNLKAISSCVAKAISLFREIIINANAQRFINLVDYFRIMEIVDNFE